MTASPWTHLFGSTLRTLVTPKCSVQEQEYAAGLLTAAHVHAHSYVSILVEGAITERYGRRVDELRAWHVQVMPAGQPHMNMYRTASRCLHLEADELVRDLAEVAGPVGPGARRDARTAVLAKLIVDEFLWNDGASPLSIDGLLYALLARPAAAPASAPAWVERVKDALHDCLRERLSLDELARIAGVHPAHLSREFHARTGRTVGEYLRQLRVACACRLLTDGTMPLAEIALECGFSDQSHFTATFRRAVGVTPARYRRLHSR